MELRHAAMEHPFLKEWFSGCSEIHARTSGSTGKPKEITLSRRDMLLSAEATCRFFGITAADRIHCPLSLDYIAGKMMVVRADISGARLTLEKPSNTPLASDTDPMPIKLLPAVPSQIPALARELACGHSVEHIIVGGAPMDETAEATARSLPARVWATYGMTETCSHVALRNVSSGASGFTALPGFKFSADRRGCLVIEHHAMSFGRIVTNDVVELLGQDRFIWRSRFDNVINSGGIKLFPEELERMIAPLVHGIPFYITSRQSPQWGQEAVMAVEPGTLPDPESTLAAIRKTLPHHLCPKAIVETPFTRTSNGKLRRQRF